MKVLLSLLMVLAIAGVAGGATFATFTDDEASRGNVFEAGTVDIDINGQNPWIEPGVQMIRFKPSMFAEWKRVIHNSGNNPVHVWKHLKRVQVFGGPAGYTCVPMTATAPAIMTSSEPECAAETNTAGLYTPINDIDARILYDLKILRCDLKVATDPTSSCALDAAEKPLFTEASQQVIFTGQEGTTAGDNVFLTGRWSQWIYLGKLYPSQRLRVIQSYHLMTGAGNAYQGDRAEWDEEYLAGQVEGACMMPLSQSNPLMMKPCAGMVVGVDSPTS